MKRIASLAFLVFTAALVGCIENPEPDPRLNWKQEKMRLNVPFLGDGDRLILHVIREGDSLRIRAENSSDTELDSALFLLQRRWPVANSYWQQPPDFPEVTQPVFERLGRLGRMLPGGSQDLGLFDSTFSSRLEDYVWSVTLLEISENGVRRGIRMGCVFQGTFRRFDLDGGGATGIVRGTLRADGLLSMGLFPDVHDIEARGQLFAPVRTDSAIMMGQYTGKLDIRAGRGDTLVYRSVQGQWRAEDNRYVGSFHLFVSAYHADHFLDTRVYPADSLEIRVEPYFPE